MTDRLKKAIETGSMGALLRELRTWQAPEVAALIEDADAHYADEQERIAAITKETIFRPEVFLSDSASSRVLQAEKDALMTALIVSTEVSMTAQIVLGELANRVAQGIANDSQIV